MRKILCISMLVAAAMLTGCGKQAGDDVDIKQVVEGENQSVETVEIPNSELAKRIKAENAGAVIEQTVNPGMKMLKVELPIYDDRDELAEEFFEDVEDIVEDCNLKNNTDYDFYYFSTSENGNTLISVAFKRENGEFVLESINGIGERYKNAAAIAERVSGIFKKTK